MCCFWFTAPSHSWVPEDLLSVVQNVRNGSVNERARAVERCAQGKPIGPPSRLAITQSRSELKPQSGFPRSCTTCTSNLGPLERRRGLSCTGRAVGRSRFIAPFRSTRKADDGTPLYKSSGCKPVCRAIRASIFGPISSLSWNAKTKLGRPALTKTRCDPRCRAMRHHVRCKAAST